MAAPVLFCSSTIHQQIAGEIEAVAPGIEIVPHRVGDRVSAEDAARITIAFSSVDLLPNGLPSFFRVCLDSPSLQWVQVFNVGVDHPVFGMLLDRGVRLTTGSGTAAIPMAHHVLLSLMAMTRDLPGAIERQRRHEWRPEVIEDIEGRVVGVLGMGPIGTEVARLAEHFGMNAIGMRRTVTGFEQCETWTFDRLDELLGVVDDLVLALPLAPATRGLIGARELALMRPGARLVNVGRGELIDEAATIDALRSGHLSGAALDVFATEPLPDDSPLWDMPNVLISPHNSGETSLAIARVRELFLANLARWHRGEDLQNEITRDVVTDQPPR